MKKYVFICLLAVTGLAMTSCQKGEPFHKKTVDMTVTTSQWDFDAKANMFFCHFDVPEITADVYNYGEVSVSREYNSGKANAYQVALPETTYMQIELDNGDGTTSPYFYQQHIDYTVGVGFVEVFCIISDFYYEEGWTPDPMLFRLQLSY